MAFTDCIKAEEFIEFFDNDDLSFRHTNYFHYTTLERANSILEAKCFKLMPLYRSSNDLVERDTYSNSDVGLFSLCFSTGISENLPLWYLYSGIDGKGARIGIKRKSFEKLINNARVSLVELEKDYPYKERLESKELKPEEYSLICRDILYIGPDYTKTETYRAKYNGKTKNDITKETEESLRKSYKRFIKGLIWFYEKETRIEVNVKNKELFEPTKNYIVTISIEDIFSDIDICLAPEYGEIDCSSIESYGGVKKWVLTKLQKSEYAGQLKMSLKDKVCNECEKAKNYEELIKIAEEKNEKA